MLNTPQHITLALTAVAASWLTLTGWVGIGLILIIVVCAFLSALAIVRRHRRAQRAKQARAWQHLIKPGFPIHFAIDEAAILFGSYPPSQEQLDEVSRQLRQNAKAPFVVWHVDLKQGPELKPWPKDEDGNKT